MLPINYTINQSINQSITCNIIFTLRAIVVADLTTVLKYSTSLSRCLWSNWSRTASCQAHRHTHRDREIHRHIQTDSELTVVFVAYKHFYLLTLLLIFMTLCKSFLNCKLVCSHISSTYISDTETRRSDVL